MAESLGDAVLHLRTDGSKLDAGIDSAKGKAKSLADDFENTGKRMQGIGTNLSLALTLPLTAFAAKAIPAAIESRQALAQVDASLKSMGPNAGRTSEQLQDLARDLENISLFDDDDILKSVTANMLTFGNISAESFDRAQTAAVNLSAKLGQDLQSSTMQIGKALNDPVRGVTALMRAGVSFTAQQKEQIKAMVAAGDAAGAQGIILSELEKQFGGAAKAQRDATPDAAAQQQWRKLQEVVGEIALKALPPLTNMLTSLLTGFNSLDPSVQSFIVGGAGIAAILGPVVLVLGTLISGVGKAIPVIRALGGAMTLLGLNPVFLTIAALVGGVYLAWQNWDKIKPIIDGVGNAVSNWWNANVQPILTFVVNKVKQVAEIFDAYFGTQIRNVVTAITALMNGDFRGAWAAMQNIVTTAVNTAWKVFQSLAPNIASAMKALAAGMVKSGGEIIQGLVTGIKAAPQAVWEALKSVVLAGVTRIREYLKIKSPSLLFHEMGGFMTAGLAKGIIDGIPEVKAAMGELGQAISDNAPGWTVDIEGGPMALPAGGGDKPTKPDDKTGAEWKEGFRNWFKDGVRAAMDGDLSGFLKDTLAGIADSMFDGALDTLANALTNLLGNLFNSGSGGGDIFSSIGSAISQFFAGWFSTGGKIPDGKFGIVGEKGPELAYSVPGGMGIRPNSALSSMQMRPSGHNINMPISINAPGADAAALERVRVSVEQLQSGLPSMIVQTVQDAGDRRLINSGGWR